MKLNLKRPLIFLDLETTGLDVATARIVEISLLKVYTDGTTEQQTFLVNPEIPIPAEISAIHGITDKDVKDKPAFKQISKQILEILANCDLAGYNILKYDLPLLVEEFLRTDILFDVSKISVIDVQNIFHKMEPRDLKGAYMFYCNKILTKAHTAEADTIAVYEILLAQIEKYKEYKIEENNNIIQPVVNNIKALAEFSVQKKFCDLAGYIVENDSGTKVFNFGKYKGQSVEEVFSREPQYYDWIQKSQFPEYTKHVFKIIYIKTNKNYNISIS